MREAKTAERKTIMANSLHNHQYGAKWTDIRVHKKERYKATWIDFHEHPFYEIQLILSGNVKIIIDNKTVDSAENKLVLVKPKVEHFVSSNPDVVYSSLYLVFTEDYIKSYDIQSMNLLSVFGSRGEVYDLTPEQTERCEKIIDSIAKEENKLRKRFLVFYLLSYIADFSKQHAAYTTTIPKAIVEAVAYINKHYAEKITAQKLADEVHIGRTTLMTQFKKYTGKTLQEYITNCRLREAINLISEGKTEYEAAVRSGFSDSSSLIQSFKRSFKITPGQYIRNIKE